MRRFTLPLFAALAAFAIATSASAVPVTVDYTITGGTSYGGGTINPGGFLSFTNGVSETGCTQGTADTGGGFCLRNMSFATTGGSTYTLSGTFTPPIFWASGGFAMDITGSGFHTFGLKNLSYDENIASPNKYCCSVYISASTGGVLYFYFDKSASSVTLAGQEVLVPEPQAMPLMGGALAVLAVYQLNRARSRRGLRRS